MEKHQLIIQKMARYFTLGNTQQPEAILLVMHGYAQNASLFIQKFAALQNRLLIVAPEGLHRFYVKGSSGNVGASWMTKEDREDDIRDYIQYLETVLHQVRSSLKADVPVFVLGFSQGAATAARWVAKSMYKVERVIFWGGLFPPDMDWTASAAVWQQLPVTIVIGDQDEYYSTPAFTAYFEPLRQRFSNVKLVRFSGGHVIDEAALISLFS